jgi:glycosyltransferase involved in cell wall biosynthesis
MKDKLSLVMMTKNSGALLEQSLSSVKDLVDEIIIVDDYSTDNTVKIAKKYNARIYYHHSNDLGKQRVFGAKKAKGDWLLFLDADEIVSEKLKKEIKKDIKMTKINGFYIPYQNHFLFRPINYGGENYQMIRLVRKNKLLLKPALVHEEILVKDKKVGYLKNKIYHYSYRSLIQMFKKFTDYAWREAKQKFHNSEKLTLKKLTLYPLHMFYARFIEDKGYKDGIRRIPLDLGFAYMELMTYFFLLILKIRQKFK